jgi:uncharacterized protein YjiS (DUF1127 family)
MNTISKAIESFRHFFDATAKARMLSTLLGMGPEWVEMRGYSYALLRKGIGAWPWRQDPAQTAEEKEIRRAIRELKGFSDRELRDLGIARAGIESAVRYGHPDRGFSLGSHDEAA